MSVLTLTAGGPMMAGVTAPRDPSWTTTTLGPDVIAYLNYLRRRRMSAKTVVNREAVLAVMCNRLDGMSLQDLSGKQGRQVLEDVLIAKEWKDLQANSLDTYISTLKAFFSWAYEEELLLHDPTRRLERPRLPERQYKLFTPDEHAALLAAQPFERDRVALMLHFEFAMRSSDLRLLQLGDIDLGQQAVRLKNGKGQTDRTLSFRTPSVFKATKAYLMLDRCGHDDEYLIYPMRTHTRGTYRPGLVLPYESKAGEPYLEPRGDGYWTEYYECETGRMVAYSPNGLGRWWKRCLERAGLPHRRPHDARHTTGTRLVGEGKNFRTVSKFLRHASLNTTELYVHLNELERMRDELWGDE